MPRDMSTEKTRRIKDITWSDAIERSEIEIRVCQDRIKILRKSLYFFKKQESLGVPFPTPEITRHKETS